MIRTLGFVIFARQRSDLEQSKEECLELRWLYCPFGNSCLFIFGPELPNSGLTMGHFRTFSQISGERISATRTEYQGDDTTLRIKS